MIRKTTGFTAIIAAITLTILAGAEGSGANAQVAAHATDQNATEAQLTEEVVPVFVEKAVVQELPGDAELPAEDSTDSASSASSSPLAPLLSDHRRIRWGYADSTHTVFSRPG